VLLGKKAIQVQMFSHKKISQIANFKNNTTVL